MPKSVEHRVQMAHIARERQAAGQPVWESRIDLTGLFHNPAMSFEQRRDAIVDILRASRWVKQADEFSRLVEVVDNLSDAEDAEEFDGWWDELYDAADYARVWIKTR